MPPAEQGLSLVFEKLKLVNNRICGSVQISPAQQGLSLIANEPRNWSALLSRDFRVRRTVVDVGRNSFSLSGDSSRPREGSGRLNVVKGLKRTNQIVGFGRS